MGLNTFLYKNWKLYREAYEKSYREKWGEPSPLSHEGQNLARAKREQEETLRNPPPIHGDAKPESLGKILEKKIEITQENDECFDYMVMGEFLNWERGAGQIQHTGELVYSTYPNHIITIAPTRSGKGVAQIIPNLLLNVSSCVVFDPKGENYRTTHAWRESIGHTVFRIDPFRVTGGTDHFNPLHLVKEYNDAVVLAKYLVPADSHKGDDFWTLEARNILAAVIMFAKEYSEKQEANIPLVRSLIAVSEDEMDELLVMMASRSKIDGVKREANVFMHKSDKERSGVLSTLNSHMAIWDDEKLAETVSFAEVDFNQLKTAAMTVYIILPFDKLSSYRNFSRMVMGSAISATMKTHAMPPFPVTMYMDEFPSLGNMEEVVESFAYLAGYGVRLWIFAQNISQLKQIYGNEGFNHLMSEAGTRCFYGTKLNHETCKMLSDELGNYTIATKGTTTGAGGSHDGTVSSNVGESINLSPTPLMDAQGLSETLSNPKVALVLNEGLKPYFAYLIHWYEEEELAKRGDGSWRS